MPRSRVRPVRLSAFPELTQTPAKRSPEDGQGNSRYLQNYSCDHQWTFPSLPAFPPKLSLTFRNTVPHSAVMAGSTRTAIVVMVVVVVGIITDINADTVAAGAACVCPLESMSWQNSTLQWKETACGNAATLACDAGQTGQVSSASCDSDQHLICVLAHWSIEDSNRAELAFSYLSTAAHESQQLIVNHWPAAAGESPGHQ